MHSELIESLERRAPVRRFNRDVRESFPCLRIAQRYILMRILDKIVLWRITERKTVRGVHVLLIRQRARIGTHSTHRLVVTHREICKHGEQYDDCDYCERLLVPRHATSIPRSRCESRIHYRVYTFAKRAGGAFCAAHPAPRSYLTTLKFKTPPRSM